MFKIEWMLKWRRLVTQVGACHQAATRCINFEKGVYSPVIISMNSVENEKR